MGGNGEEVEPHLMVVSLLSPIEITELSFGSGLARRRSGDDGVGDLGRGGSVDVWEGDGEARSGNEGRKRPVRGELELAGGNGGQRAGSGREGRVLLLL